VCISPTDGSGGEFVGPMVAEALGFQLLNAQIVMRAAEEAGVDPADVAGAEGRQSLAVRLLGRLTESGPSAPAGLPGHAATSDDDGPDREALREVIRAIIREAGERGDVVIVTHAASYALADRSDVLRVLISASPETRARRIAEAKGWSDSAAAKAVARGDAGRADYLKRFYGIDAELPAHYDIVIDTDALDPEAAAEMIVSAARGTPSSRTRGD
jgi:cytidylate kinase